jgi:hypothetical protein
MLKQRPLLSRLGTYLHVQLLRPTLMHMIVSWATLQRHTSMRSAQKKAEFADNASRITWVGGVVNLVLAALKLAAGICGRSAAMIADAGHSFSDLVSDAVTLLALRLSSLPADVDHPYGHGRFESVASLAIGSLLLAAGASFGASAFAALRVPTVQPLGAVSAPRAVNPALLTRCRVFSSRRVPIASASGRLRCGRRS